MNGHAAHLSVTATSEGEQRRARGKPASGRSWRGFASQPATRQPQPGAPATRPATRLSERSHGLPGRPGRNSRHPGLRGHARPERPADPSSAAAWLTRQQAMPQEEKTAESKVPWTPPNWLSYPDPAESEDRGTSNDRSRWRDAGTGEPGTGRTEAATTR